ncbi:MAG: hypothetical protein AAF430_11170 [Myxococcota bacterium]
MADPPLQPVLRPARATGAPAPLAKAPQPASEIPERYAIREKEGDRALVCDEAPRLRVILDPEMAASRSDAGALGERVILLDGAGSFGPLLDTDRQLYNLDHHAGCERLFTLATCEQALLLVASGLDLGSGDWTLYANDPDLDTILALWCLLNHRRVRELRPEARDVLLPLLRFEGAIDANGLSLAQWCGLPSHSLAAAQRNVDALVAREKALRQAGAWNRKDPTSYTLEMLRAVDAMVYQGEDFGDYTRVEEIYGHVEIAPGSVAVVCRDRSGIYTVEQLLKTRWGDQLSVIALENQPGVYTLRRVNSLAGPDLEPAYALLNRIDPAVDGRPVGKRWGGSQDIGGSPRPRGTQLASAEVLEILSRAYERPSRWSRLGRMITAFAVGIMFLGFWPLAAALPSLEGIGAADPAYSPAFELGKIGLLALAIGTVATRAAARWRPWVFGWRAPAPGRWAWLAPAVFLCALPVRGWTPLTIGDTPLEILAALVAGALTLTAAEVWFRGLVHGMLSVDEPVQHPGGPWWLSRATWVSALAYAAVTSAFSIPTFFGTGLEQLGLSSREMLAFVASSALLGGLALGVIRERSLSIGPGIALQLVGGLGALALWFSWT